MSSASPPHLLTTATYCGCMPRHPRVEPPFFAHGLEGGSHGKCEGGQQRTRVSPRTSGVSVVDAGGGRGEKRRDKKLSQSWQEAWQRTSREVSHSWMGLPARHHLGNFQCCSWQACASAGSLLLHCRLAACEVMK